MVPQFYLPADGTGTFVPALYGAAHIRFADKKRKFDETRRVRRLLLMADAAARAVDWDVSEDVAIEPDQLVKAPPVQAPHAPLPTAATDAKTFARWVRAFDRWLARTQRVTLPAEPSGEPVVLRPRRGGLSVDLVAVVWQLRA